MKRIILLALIALASCIPAYETALPEQITLTQEGSTYTLTSDAPLLRGSVGIRARDVVSPLCAVQGCIPDSQGIVLLQLLEGTQYGSSVELGQIEELVRLKVVVVQVGARFALERVFEAANE